MGAWEELSEPWRLGTQTRRAGRNAPGNGWRETEAETDTKKILYVMLSLTIVMADSIC